MSGGGGGWCLVVLAVGRSSLCNSLCFEGWVFFCNIGS